METKEEKCQYCGCRGESTICYYDCGCHKPKDKEVLPKKWPQEIGKFNKYLGIGFHSW